MKKQDLPPFENWLASHIFTATDLENYRLCPYRFYASRYLQLRQADPFEVEMTPAEIGSLVHRILERFLRREGSVPAQTLLDQELQNFSAERPHLSRPLLVLQKQKIERMLSSFLEDLKQEKNQAAAWKPRFFEWSFGQDNSPLLLNDSEGKPVSFRGRIDRIDVNEDRKQFLVIDYKTGATKITGNQIKNGESFQLPLYLLAVQRLLLKDYQPAGAIYYQLSDMSKKDGLLHADRLPSYLQVGPRSSSCIPATKWENLLDSIQARIGEVVSEIRKTPENGFYSQSEPCEPFCPYQDICKLRTCEP